MEWSASVMEYSFGEVEEQTIRSVLRRMGCDRMVGLRRAGPTKRDEVENGDNTFWLQVVVIKFMEQY